MRRRELGLMALALTAVLRPAFAQDAKELARSLAEHQVGIIYKVEYSSVPVEIGIEFLGRGITISFDMGVTIPTATVTLSGPKQSCSLSPGEPVPGYDDLIVKKIERNGVTYRFKEEEFKVAFP